MEKEKARHKELLQEKGTFTVDCNHVIFSIEELEILGRYGHWFKALAEGILYPITEQQRHFVEMTKGHQDPFSIEEKAWFKYAKRKEIEEKSGDVHYNTPRLDIDHLYDGQGLNSLQESVYGTIEEDDKD